MIILITGASHTGKTMLAQRLLVRYQYPYVSMDLLKMGLIRSGNTDLTPEDDEELTAYLWPIVREMIRTALENKQNLIVEGCYIPFGWKADFSEAELREIRYYCIVMKKSYITKHFLDIQVHAGDIEQRLDDNGCTMDAVLKDNAHYLEMCRKYGYHYILIEDNYQADLENGMKGRDGNGDKEIG